MRALPPLVLIVLLSRGVGQAQGADKLLANPSDYPTLYDAINREISETGLGGGSKVIPMETKVMDDGVRVMPVQTGVSGRLSQLANFVDALRRKIPYASRPYEVVLKHSPPEEGGTHPFHIEILLALPVLAPLQAADEASRDDLLKRRADADRIYWEAAWSALDQVFKDGGNADWLDTLLIRDRQVVIDGVITPSTNQKQLLDRLKKMKGFVLHEVFGPQEDPSDEKHRKRFRIMGELDVPSSPR